MTLSQKSFVSSNIAQNARELGTLIDSHQNQHVRFGQYLRDHDLVSKELLNEALSIQSQFPKKKLGEILTDIGALTKLEAQTSLLIALELPIVELVAFDIDPDAIVAVPAELACRYHVMPLMFHDEMLVIATHVFLEPDALEILRFTIQRHLILVSASMESINKAIADNYLIVQEAQELADLQSTSYDAELDQRIWKEAEHLAKQQPIVKLVNSIILDAIHQKASDIHIRPNEKTFTLLFRIDGTMIPMRELQMSLLPAVVSRIKILARLNIADRRLPQDGRVHFRDDNNSIDLRISIIPVQYGESVVIRVLNKNQGIRSISEIGFKPADQALFLDLLKRSYGIILVTGPTGSGKSTTLYSALQEVQKQNLNIITVEDPIEYELANTRQIQLIPAIHFSFPQALKHILRHDPDVIMIGEMRDLETCKIAVESALTGHLVFSTLHTNDAASAIVRLMEIGIAPYLIRSAVIGVLAQRLVRCNCSHCKTEEVLDPLVRANLGITNGEKFFYGRGCAHCHQTGFSGRMAIYELLVMNDELRSHVDASLSTEHFREMAVVEGMVTLPLNGIEQARTGKISIAEVYRACM